MILLQSPIHTHNRESVSIIVCFVEVEEDYDSAAILGRAKQICSLGVPLFVLRRLEGATRDAENNVRTVVKIMILPLLTSKAEKAVV